MDGLIAGFLSPHGRDGHVEAAAGGTDRQIARVVLIDGDLRQIISLEAASGFVLAVVGIIGVLSPENRIRDPERNNPRGREQ